MPFSVDVRVAPIPDLETGDVSDFQRSGGFVGHQVRTEIRGVFQPQRLYLDFLMTNLPFSKFAKTAAAVHLGEREKLETE